MKSYDCDERLYNVMEGYLTVLIETTALFGTMQIGMVGNFFSHT